MSLFKTSKEAREILERFRRASGVRPNLWARAALGYSLSLEATPEDLPYDSEGTEFNARVFFGDDEPTLLALLRQRHNQMFLDEKEFDPIIKRHVERGLRHFNEEFERLNRRGDELLLHLLELCAKQTESPPIKDLLPPKPKAETYELTAWLGESLRSHERISHILNGPGSAPHIAIMGRNGTGKTRTTLGILEKIKETAGYLIPFLIFDYAKGDIASDQDFVTATEAVVIRLPDDRIPLAPLSLPVRDEHSIQLAARRFRDTIRSVVRLGPKQANHCLRFIQETYARAEGRTPDLDDLVAIAEERYREEDWPPDSLIACLHEFTDFPLFRSAAENENHDFFRQTHIIDLHRMPEDLRKLSAFLVLDRLYAEIMALPDAPLDKKGFRQLRLIIVIDEAHHYLPCRQPTLEGIVREVRSKGVAVMLLSQSPDDFDQRQYNFAREMGLSLVFACVLERPKMLEALLGGRVDPRRLSQLPAGVALTRVANTPLPIDVQVWQQPTSAGPGR